MDSSKPFAFAPRLRPGDSALWSLIVSGVENPSSLGGQSGLGISMAEGRAAEILTTIKNLKGKVFMESIEKTIEVDAPLSVVYNQWTQFEDFPQFMEGVKEVRQIDDKRLHWVAEIG